MSGNEAWNRNVFKRLRKVHWQAVPDGGSGDWEGPAADRRQSLFTCSVLILFICSHIMLRLQPKRHLLMTDLVAAFVLFTFMLVFLYRCVFCVVTVSR